MQINQSRKDKKDITMQINQMRKINKIQLQKVNMEKNLKKQNSNVTIVRSLTYRTKISIGIYGRSIKRNGINLSLKDKQTVKTESSSA